MNIFSDKKMVVCSHSYVCKHPDCSHGVVHEKGKKHYRINDWCDYKGQCCPITNPYFVSKSKMYAKWVKQNRFRSFPIIRYFFTPSEALLWVEYLLSTFSTAVFGGFIWYNLIGLGGEAPIGLNLSILYFLISISFLIHSVTYMRIGVEEYKKRNRVG